MPIAFACPHCGRRTTVADPYAGQSGPCAGCGRMITIPTVVTVSPPLAAPAPQQGLSGGAIRLIALAVGIPVLVCGGILVAVLLGSREAARRETDDVADELRHVQAAREAARRALCTDNLKQIGLALLNYHDVYKTFPPAYVPDRHGRPMHSWRTLILPFLEQRALYDRYDFNEPWDSPANRMVTGTVIREYRCPSASGSNPTETNFMVISGKGLVFDGPNAVGMTSIYDGTSNTIAVVEVAGTGVPWASPVDLDAAKLPPQVIQPGNANAISSSHPGGAQLLFCDGAVRFFAAETPPERLRGWLTRAGFEPWAPD